MSITVYLKNNTVISSTADDLCPLCHVGFEDEETLIKHLKEVHQLPEIKEVVE